jgi:outer membrane murein-binding lipoprotein Lpp
MSAPVSNDLGGAKPESREELDKKLNEVVANINDINKKYAQLMQEMNRIANVYIKFQGDANAYNRSLAENFADKNVIETELQKRTIYELSEQLSKLKAASPTNNGDQKR